MPLYPMKCRGKAHHKFDAVRVVDDRNKPMRCAYCRATAFPLDHYELRGFSARAEAAMAQAFKAPVVYQAKDGTFRFPGASNSKETARLERMGFKRVELTTSHAIRKFEKQMNEGERQKYYAFQAGRERLFREQLRQNRESKEFQQAYSRMNVQERAFADLCMQQNNEKRFAAPSFDPGFNIQAFSYDSSNREEHRDVSTGWRGRKE